MSSARYILTHFKKIVLFMTYDTGQCTIHSVRTVKYFSTHCATLQNRLENSSSLLPLVCPHKKGRRILPWSYLISARELSTYTILLRNTENVGKPHCTENSRHISPSQIKLSDATANPDPHVSVTEQDIVPGQSDETEVDILAQTANPEIIDTFAEMPLMPESITLVSYVDHSPTLQKLVQMGVDLSKVERKPGVANMLLQMDFECDIKDKMAFLHRVGVPGVQLGTFITKNPHILGEELQNLEARVHYLHQKNFSNDDVCQIVNRAPYFLSFSIERIDSKLGFFQQLFGFNDQEVRQVITRCPKLVTMKVSRPKENIFVLQYQLGFSKDAIKRMVLEAPSLLLRGKFQLIAVFDYLHNVMGIPHTVMLKSPQVFGGRVQRLQDRHKYLTMLKRNQYDPKEPGYIPVMALFKLPDDAFCQEIANTSIEAYNNFLKTCRV